MTFRNRTTLKKLVGRHHCFSSTTPAMATRRRATAGTSGSPRASTWEEREEEGRAGWSSRAANDPLTTSGNGIGGSSSSRAVGGGGQTTTNASFSSDDNDVSGKKGHHHRQHHGAARRRRFPWRWPQGGAHRRHLGNKAVMGASATDQALYDLGMVAAASIVVTAVVTVLLFQYASILEHSPLRLPILIRRLDFSSIEDLGGWIDKPYAFPRLSSLDPLEDGQEDEFRSDVPDYGEVEYDSLPSDKFYRQVDPNAEEKYERDMAQKRKKKSQHVSHHWAFDDDEVLDSECRRPEWWSGYYPTCNNFHQYDLTLKYDENIRGAEFHEYDSAYIAHGYFREVWLVENHGYEGPDETLALKLFRYKHEMNFKQLETIRKDALVMERLTASPRIVNMYGHCAFSVTVEAIDNEMEKFIVPGNGYAQPEDLDDSQDVDPKNGYTVPEKLDIALAMAESLADLHGFAEGVIVHDDVQLCQWLKTRDGVIKLGDFNRAEFMFYDEEKEIYCKYNNGKGYGNYRAPEEFDAQDLNEQIDVFSMGNNIFGLLTGLWVFPENEDDGVVQKKIIKGEVSPIDERYRTRSYIEGRLVEIMERCWEYVPEKRANIFEVVDFLKETKAEYDRRVAAGEEERPPPSGYGL